MMSKTLIVTQESCRRKLKAKVGGSGWEQD